MAANTGAGTEQAALQRFEAGLYFGLYAELLDKAGHYMTGVSTCCNCF